MGSKNCVEDEGVILGAERPFSQYLEIILI